MNLYIVNLNGQGTTYVKLEDIPFEISEDKLDELYKTNLVRFFSKDGEITILFSKNNEEVYNEFYSNPKPLVEDGFISISHYNKEGKLHSDKDNIPSIIDTLKKKKAYHENGTIKNPSIKERLEDDYGEYTLLKNIQKNLNLQEVRCYTDGFRQHIENNGDIEWILNKELHSPSNDIPAKIKYYSDGSIQSEAYYINGKSHRENSPALIFYKEDGSVSYEEHYIDGKRHREDGPALIYYYPDGSIKSEYYYVNGKSHRKEEPSYISYNPNGSIKYKEYHINNKLHRENGAAQIWYNEDGSIQYEEYYMNEKYHREDGPAVISYEKDGLIKSKKYYIHGKLNREDGPAIIHYYSDGSIKYEKYYINSQLHRDEAPAYIEYNQDGSIIFEKHYINGINQISY
jgi:antitoxin component YwqK of YwqJK toxin-antitoxin module